jgi:transcriptional antiterminator NusG
MAKQTANYGRRWYAIHTYSGFEEKVLENLQTRVDTMDMDDKIFNIMVPKEKKVKIKNGKRRVVEEKIFPGYVLVEMVVTDDSWYVVRNTPNVTGFIGAGTTPTPIAPEEIEALIARTKADEPDFTIDLQEDDAVQISDGPFKGQQGKVSEVDQSRGKVKVLVSVFGRETPVELDFLQVKKV